MRAAFTFPARALRQIGGAGAKARFCLRENFLEKSIQNFTFTILHFTFTFEILRLAFYRAPENRNEVRFLGRGGAALQVVHFAQRQNADSMGERRRAQDDRGGGGLRPLT